MRLIVLTSLLIGLAGCSSSRTINDLAGAGIGGAAGFLGSKGDPLIAAGGAAAGLAISEMTHAGEAKNDIAQYNRGYNRGRSDNAKLTYELVQDLQKPKNQTPQVKVVKYKLPKNNRSGLNLEPSDRSLSVVEPKKSGSTNE